MFNHKLLDLLCSLSASERNRFEKYLESPYHNPKLLLLNLYKELDLSTDHFKDLSFSKKGIWDTVLDHRPYNDGAMRRLLSDLTKQVEQFLAMEQYRQNETDMRLNLLQALNERKLYKYVPNQIKFSREKLKKAADRDARYYHQHFSLERINVQFTLGKDRLVNESDIETALNYLDSFFVVHKLRSWCGLLNLKQVISVEEKIFLMDAILEHLKTNSYDDEPAIDIYYTTLLTLSESEETGHFFKLKALLDRHSHKFPLDEAREMYVYAQNFCLRRVNSGDADFLAELFGLYRQALAKGVLFEQSGISPWTYKNIVTTGLRLGEEDWVFHFINTYKSQIDEVHRENAFNYNLANYYYYQKDFEKALRLLQQVEFNDVFYSLDSRAMLMKTYYELGEYDSLYSLLESFRVFLIRNRLISDRHRTNYGNAIKFLRRLSKIHSGQKDKLEKLKTTINETRQIADKRWLLEKVGEL